MSLPASLSSTEDAIRVASTALGRDGLVAIVEGDAKLIMPISGQVPPGAVVRLDHLLLLAAGDDPGRLVFATRRRTGPPIALEDEIADWRAMLAAHDGRSLVLVDWFVFTGEAVVSMAELVGPPARWEG